MIRHNVRRAAAAGAALALTAGVAITGLSVTQAGAAGVPGVTATSITIGATVPLTGIASPGYSEVGKAARAVFDYVNTHGKINGRSVKFVLKDDCYNTPGFGCEYANPSTVNQTNALLQQGIFATVGSLGTPPQDLVRSMLRSAHTPQLFVNSGSRDWNNPGTYPTLFGWQPSYITEAKILGHFVHGKYPGQKFCFLGQHDDFGADGLIGLQDMHMNPSVSTMYDVANLVILGSSYFTPIIKNFQTSGCKVVYMDTIPAATAAALGNAVALHYAPHWIISSVGADPVTVNNVLKGKIKPDPEINAISFSYLNATTDTSAQGKLWKAFDIKVLKADHADFPKFTSKTPIDGNMAYGVAWGVAFAEALRAAGKTFTQASLVHILLTTSFSQTPSLTPLAYSASNHQGLNAGYVTIIKSAAVVGIEAGTIYQADSNVNASVTVAPKHSKGIPPWL
jgi:ABC-type branched-subunit amino acid transport system substrate-binding protein